ncbi:hypothetical protein, partial [Bartonella sp. OD88NMGDW]|uniref:hypothetical protein n=1 Tax=Bartonella sp. OD88NMGDW TaxID=3243571 RepID=UPI0035CF46F8
KREAFKEFGQLDQIALQSAIVQCLHHCSFEELGKHYPIAVLMQLDQLDPISRFSNWCKLHLFLTSTPKCELLILVSILFNTDQRVKLTL